jgi:hypothetical protein
MGTANEEVWEHEGLFNTVDNLCRDLGGAKNLNEPLNLEFNAPQPPPTTFKKVTAKGSPGSWKLSSCFTVCEWSAL